MARQSNKKYQLIWYLLVLVLFVCIAFYLPSITWLKQILLHAFRLTWMTTLATMLGTIVEERNWTSFLEKITFPVVRWAKLPKLCGSALFTSFFSLLTGNSMLANQYADGNISRVQLRISAMANSYLSMINHSLRVLYPVVAAIGGVGLCYFGIMYGGGFLIVFVAFIYNRIRPQKFVNKTGVNAELSLREVGTWRSTILKSWKRSKSLIRRMIGIAIPLYILFSYLAEIGVFHHIGTSYFQNIPLDLSPEAVAVMMSMMGGLLSAATVGAGFLHDGSIDHVHLLLALLCGNLISMPIRTLRRNLPSALGIFSSSDAFFIVFVNQGARVVVTTIAVLVLSLCFM